MQKYYFCLLLILTVEFTLQAQNAEDSTRIYQEFIKINDTTYLFLRDTIQELWIEDKTAETWKLGKHTEIRTFYNNSFRLLIQRDNYSLWKYNKQINDWELHKSFLPGKIIVNDSVSYEKINDTTKYVEISGKKFNYRTNPNIFIFNKTIDLPNYIIDDTIQLWKVNDTVSLWVNKDSTVLWYLDKKPVIWQISSSTIVWTLNGETEFWKSGKQYSIWKVKKGKGWEKTAQKPYHYLEPMDLWQVNNRLMIQVRNDSVQIWHAKPEKLILKIADSLLIWQIPPPLVDTLSEDTLQIPEKQVQEADLMNFKDLKIWSINDSVKVWDQDKRKELLFLNKKAHLWKINDSSLIWSINDSCKVSFMSDTIVLWHRNDSTYEWEADEQKQVISIADSMRVLEVNDTIRFAVLNDSTSIWNALISSVISKKNELHNFYMINDSTELWEPNDSIKLWIGKYASLGDVWQKNKHVNILNINDSTKIWQINEQVRLSIINHRLKVWRQGGDEPAFPWRELNNDLIILNDSLRIWPIDNRTMIWETRQKIEVWNKKTDEKLYRLTDSTLIWTYSANNQAAILKKPKFWSWNGTGKMDVSQAYLQNWIKGGESSINMLFIINLMANYNRRKVKWDNAFEYRFGILKSGKYPIRKNNDKIKIQSIFNYYAKDKWYYSFSSSIETQFFKGYNYKDTIQELVSIFSGPLYTQLALGMNYFPLPQVSVFFSPLTHKLTYVRDTSLIDQTLYGIDADKNQKNEPGAIVKTVVNWQINKNIHLLNKLDFFTNYSHNPQNVDVDWQLTMTFKLSKILNTTLTTHLIYDDDVKIPRYNDLGEKIGEGPAVQFKEVISIGFFYQLQ